MSWIKALERLLFRVALAHNEDKANEWMEQNEKLISALFIEEDEDKELDSFQKHLDELFTQIDKKSKGKFYKRFDWYIERDENNKLVLHVFEI